jgi:hypothetical protein
MLLSLLLQLFFLFFQAFAQSGNLLSIDFRALECNPARQMFSG